MPVPKNLSSAEQILERFTLNIFWSYYRIVPQRLGRFPLKVFWAVLAIRKNVWKCNIL